MSSHDREEVKQYSNKSFCSRDDHSDVIASREQKYRSEAISSKKVDFRVCPDYIHKRWRQTILSLGHSPELNAEQQTKDSSII